MKKLFCFLSLFFALSISAATLDDVSFPDKVKVEGKELQLNGIGIRKATIFKVKVYYGGLYLEQKSKDPSTFLNSVAPKQIIMHFVRDVDAQKLRDTFKEGMEAANANHANFKLQMDKLNGLLSDVKNNEQFTFTFLSDGVVFQSNKRNSPEKILGDDFSKALLNIWFINPRDPGLRSGMLGL